MQDESLAPSGPGGRYSARTYLYPDGGVETVVRELDDGNPEAGQTVWDTAVQGQAPDDVWKFPRRPRRRATEENQERIRVESARRAKSRIRRTCRARGYDRLLTLTTQEESNSPEELWELWDLMRRRIARDPALGEFSYVAVPEPHPTNPGHWHLHLAIRGYKDANVLRKHWVAVLRGRGKKGGNVDIAAAKSKRYKLNRRTFSPAQIARYLAKYIGKSLERPRDEAKRYWASRCGTPIVMHQWHPAATDLNELRIEVLLDPDVRHRMSDFFSPVRGVYWMEGWS